jgi:exopolyphosphatase
VEDLDLAAFHSAGKLRMVLVDHNRPAGSHDEFFDTVEGVIDHHADEGLFTDVSIRVVEPVGSAATLVARAILKENAAALEESSALLLLGTILLDTVNLDPEAGRVTPEDQAIAEKLLALTDANQQELFDSLQREKFNVSALDSSDLLRKDYKEWKMGDLQVGVSSVLLSIGDWLKKDANLSESLATYARSRKLDLLLAMNAYTNPEFTRELVVYCPDTQLRSKVVPFLEKSELGLSPIASGTVDEATALYSQSNKGISRKKLQPLLLSFLEGDG